MVEVAAPFFVPLMEDIIHNCKLGTVRDAQGRALEVDGGQFYCVDRPCSPTAILGHPFERCTICKRTV